MPPNPPFDMITMWRAVFGGGKFVSAATSRSRSSCRCAGTTLVITSYSIHYTKLYDMHGTEAQKKKFLTRLLAGEWTGTMCLTEPHAGSDVGLLRTKAEPQADGSYTITGTKIFISSYNFV